MLTATFLFLRPSKVCIELPDEIGLNLLDEMFILDLMPMRKITFHLLREVFLSNVFLSFISLLRHQGLKLVDPKLLLLRIAQNLLNFALSSLIRPILSVGVERLSRLVINYTLAPLD